VSCGEVHSHAREMVTQGYTTTLVATNLAISPSSSYYRKKPRGSWADRRYDEHIAGAAKRVRGDLRESSLRVP
jgi:predicted transcriptional regulator